MNAVRIGGLFLVLFFVAGCPTVPDENVAFSPIPESPQPPQPSPTVSPQVLALEEAAHDLINAERRADGAAPLTMREDIRRVARAHSEDMVARRFFDHTNPDNESPWDRLGAAGISWRSAGENIAWNNYSNQAQTAVNGWMNSSGHRNNILNRNFTYTGMGVALDGRGGAYFTQVFIRP